MILRVAGRSVPRAVAGAIAHNVRKGEPVELQAVGAEAVNQAVKAIALAVNYLAGDGIAIACVPRMMEVPVSPYHPEVRRGICLKILVGKLEEIGE